MEDVSSKKGNQLAESDRSRREAYLAQFHLD